jgi:hypothetical protein
MEIAPAPAQLNPKYQPPLPYTPPWGLILTVVLIPVYLYLWALYPNQKARYQGFWSRVWAHWSGYQTTGARYLSGLPELPNTDGGVTLMACRDALRVFTASHVASLPWNDGRGFRQVTAQAIGDQLHVRVLVGDDSRVVQFSMYDESRVHEWRDIMIAASGIDA